MATAEPVWPAPIAARRRRHCGAVTRKVNPSATPADSTSSSTRWVSSFLLLAYSHSTRWYLVDVHFPWNYAPPSIENSHGPQKSTKSLITFCRSWRYVSDQNGCRRWDCHRSGHRHLGRVGLIDGSHWCPLRCSCRPSWARALHLTDDRFDRSACWHIRLFGCVTREHGWFHRLLPRPKN